MDNSRRRFIQTSSLGLLGTLIPFQLYGKTIYELPPSLLQERLKEAADLRKEGRINRAINKFTRITQDYPSDIRGYDGLRKALLQKKYKELEVLQLYEAGFLNNPNNKDFKQRLAKEYMRMILGNTKFTNQYNSSENLLVRAHDFFRDLKNEYPERPEYLQLFRKVKRKIEHQADTVDARVNNDLKAYKNSQRKKFKRRFKDRSEAEIENKLNELLVKPDNPTRKRHIKELYRILIKRKRANQDWISAFSLAQALYNVDKSDSVSLRIVKRMANKTNSYNELVAICQENRILQDTFWAKVGLFDAELKRYNKTGSGSLAVMSQLVDELLSEASDTKETIEAKERAIRLCLKQQNFALAQTHLISLGELLSGTENPHLAILYSVLTARYFTKQQNYNDGILTIRALLGEAQIEEDSSILLQLVDGAIQGVTIEKEVHLSRLNKVLNRLHNRQNP